MSKDFFSDKELADIISKHKQIVLEGDKEDIIFFLFKYIHILQITLDLLSEDTHTHTIIDTYVSDAIDKFNHFNS